MGRFADRWPDLGQSPTSTSAWAPNVDIFESDDALVVKAELPGIDPKDVELNVENNVLTISGERKLEFEDKKENYHRVERAYGSFSRSFSLPRLIDETQIAADYKDGVLTVRVPKHEKAKPRQIKISA
jgi:HSP20 family protein